MFWHSVLCPLSSNSSQKHRYRQRTKAVLGGYCHVDIRRCVKTSRPFSKRSARPQTFINFMRLVCNATRQPNQKTVRFGLSNSYPYDKNFSILAPYIDLCGKLMTHKNATSNKRQREPIFDVNSVHVFIHFIAIFPLYIYTKFCNVHPRVTASSRFLRGLPVVLE